MASAINCFRRVPLGGHRGRPVPGRSLFAALFGTVSSRGMVEVTKRLFVVLDGVFLDGLRAAERCLATCIADGPVRPQSLLEHAHQQRNLSIHVIEDSDLLLPGVETVKAPRILREGPLPRDRHREKERVEAGVVEAFADVLARRKNETLYRVRDRGKLSPDLSPFRRGHASMEHDEVPYETPQPLGEILEVVA